MTIPARLDRSLNASTPWLFLSPHLDDAVLSCGALIEAFATRRNVTVATVFTEAAPPPHTRAARNFLSQCSVCNANTLFAERRNEDETALAGLHVRHLHLGATDALFRQRCKAKARLGPMAKIWPELIHLYPTYRFDIALGRISRGDRVLIAWLRSQVADLLEQTRAELLFCPVGIGRHVDHLITRMVGSEFPDRVVYYSDFPYNQSACPDLVFLQKYKLMGWKWETDMSHKLQHINDYASQALALFPDGKIPAAAETYFAASCP